MALFGGTGGDGEGAMPLAEQEESAAEGKQEDHSNVSVNELLELYTLAQLFNMAKDDEELAGRIIPFHIKGDDAPRGFTPLKFACLDFLQVKLAVRYPQFVGRYFLQGSVDGFSEWYFRNQNDENFRAMIPVKLAEYLNVESVRSSGSRLQYAFSLFEGLDFSPYLTFERLAATSLSDNPVIHALLVSDEAFIATTKNMNTSMSEFCDDMAEKYSRGNGKSSKQAQNTAQHWANYSEALKEREAVLQHKLDAAASAAALTAGGRRRAQEHGEEHQCVLS